ncbi:MAG: GDSL-type esterase/lipase family protein [Bacteroides sp.]|nr:GDSL-type esterase/lipase family protein [Bacteroides sp.]
MHLKPDVVSILIGVNDFWHTLSGSYDGTVEKYENDYRTLLTETRSKLPGTQFVIGEPFTIRGGSSLSEKWYPAFDAYQAVARKLTKEFNAVFVPYQRVFDKALEKPPFPIGEAMEYTPHWPAPY